MNAKAFFDTNILVYAHDERDMAKYQQAKQLLRAGLQDGNAVISSQVIQEFCNVMLKRATTQVTPNILNLLIETTFIKIMQHVPNQRFYSRSLELFETYNLSWYDALIVQAALDLNCDTLYSEDLQAGQQFGSLTVVNPFA